MIETNLNVDIKDTLNYFENVSKDISKKVNEDIPNIQKDTKKVVKSHLSKGNGVDKGIYKRSIVYRNLSNSEQIVHFQVGGNKKHYRLTHLLEHGHKMIPNKHFYRHVVRTKAIPHIQYGQDYADKAVENLYEKAIELALGKD